MEVYPTNEVYNKRETDKVAYKTAFLTNRGWAYNEWNYMWSKEGIKKTQEEYNKLKENFYYYARDEDVVKELSDHWWIEFSLEEAFDRENDVQIDEKDLIIKDLQNKVESLTREIENIKKSISRSTREVRYK